MLNSKKKNRLLNFILISTVILSSFIPRNVNFTVTTAQMKDQSEGLLDSLEVLIILGNQFGDSYFWLKKQFELWDCNVTTAGTSAVVASCPNKPPRPVTANITIDEITQDNIDQFDCVIIPSGAHWVNLLANTIVHDLLTLAYESGLVIGGICIGTKILPKADGLVNGVKVVYYSESYQEMVDAGAKIIYDTNVVSDKRIVTAGKGQYHSTHPAIYPFCVAIAKAVLDLSAFVSTTLTSVIGESNGNFSISVQTNNLSTIFYDNVSTTILSVKAVLVSSNDLINNTIKALLDNNNGTYTTTFSLTEVDEFSINIYIKSFAWGIECINSINEYTTKRFGFTNIIAIFIMCILPMYYFIKRGKRKV